MRFRFIQSDAKPRTPKPSLGVRIDLASAFVGEGEVFWPRLGLSTPSHSKMSTGGAACCPLGPTLSTSSCPPERERGLLVSRMRLGLSRSSKQAGVRTPPEVTRKNLPHREQSGSKLRALQMNVIESKAAASCATPNDVTGGAAALRVIARWRDGGGPRGGLWLRRLGRRSR